MPKPKKNISSPVVEDSDDDFSSEEEKPAKKKQKKETTTTTTSKPKENSSSGNEVEWNISADKIVKIREFRGKIYVDIRQYYNGPNGNLLPTKKGISLTAENYQKLKSLISEIDDSLRRY